MSSRPSRGAARLAAILDALPDALLLVNANGTVVNANSIALDVFETPGTALIGRGLLDLVPAFDSKRIPGSMRRPDDRIEERQPPTRMVARRTDGSEFPVEVTSANLEDGRTTYESSFEAAYADHGGYGGNELLMLVVRDLSGTLDTEAELARQQRQTEMILRAAAEGVVGTDTEGRVVLVNPAAAQILGYRASDLGGQALHPLVHHTRADGTPQPYEETPLADTLRSSRKHRVRGQVLWSKKGERVPVDMTTAPVRDGDQLVGAVLTFTDRRATDALEARHAQLLSVVDEALRGPLEELRGELAGLAADPAGQLWPEANQILHHLSAGYARMTTLIDNVVQYQRLDSGREKLDRKQVSLDAVIAGGVESAVELIGPGRAQFAVHAPPIQAVVDPDRLALAIAHLVADVAGVDVTGNSTVAGGPQDSTIVVAAAKRGGSGRGEEATKESVVRIEVRGPHSGGNPVHLPIARGVVARHGGVLQTHEVPGGGSAYVLEVPLGDVSDEPVASPPQRPARGALPAPGPEPQGEPTQGTGSMAFGNGTTVMPRPARPARGTPEALALPAGRDRAPQSSGGLALPPGSGGPGPQAQAGEVEHQQSAGPGQLGGPVAAQQGAQAEFGDGRELGSGEVPGPRTEGEPVPATPAGRRSRRTLRPVDGRGTGESAPSEPVQSEPASEPAQSEFARPGQSQPGQAPLPGGYPQPVQPQSAGFEPPAAQTAQTAQTAQAAQAEQEARAAQEAQEAAEAQDAPVAVPNAWGADAQIPQQVQPGTGRRGRRAKPAPEGGGEQQGAPAGRSPFALPPAAADRTDGSEGGQQALGYGESASGEYPAQPQRPTGRRRKPSPAAEEQPVPPEQAVLPEQAVSPEQVGSPEQPVSPEQPAAGEAEQPMRPEDMDPRAAGHTVVARSPILGGAVPPSSEQPHPKPLPMPGAPQTADPSAVSVRTLGQGRPYAAQVQAHVEARAAEQAQQPGHGPESALRPETPPGAMPDSAPQPPAPARPQPTEPQPSGQPQPEQFQQPGQQPPVQPQQPQPSGQHPLPQHTPPGGTGRRRKLAAPPQQDDRAGTAPATPAGDPRRALQPPRRQPAGRQPGGQQPVAPQQPGGQQPGGQQPGGQQPGGPQQSGRQGSRYELPPAPQQPQPAPPAGQLSQGQAGPPGSDAQPLPAGHTSRQLGSMSGRPDAARQFTVTAPDAEAAEGPEPLDGPNGAAAVADPAMTMPLRPIDVDDELPPEPLDNPRRLLVWPEPDVTTQQALTDRGYRPVLVHSREEVDAQIAAYPAALFVDPLTGPITRTALQSLRQAAVAAEVPVLVTAGLGQATREAAYGADPAVLLKALAPRDSEQHPPRVLLVEGEPVIAQAFAATLERRGMQVAHAPSDGQAVEVAAQIRPNLVVMDLAQIRRRRAGVIDWLRVNGLLNRTPFVVYTSAGMDREQLAGLAAGETVLFLAERSTSVEVQSQLVDLLAKIGTG
ncbi:PAS domain-containing protein [Streptomyces sp. XM4193]|uniref:hybrid sensor histidine kinase/response regulator n=1 Tax=Streptomyces sp. XM4193 TaxID=2929782 RepID=UPI001FF94689|nr:PAS domain-containing protein [Streptomyces sp. XM4193]MCK1794809.1 PAS domain-containing protein [Streptomyces sp. XM4193]